MADEEEEQPGFSFPALPQRLPPQNPLMARATVEDRTAGAAAAAAAPSSSPLADQLRAHLAAPAPAARAPGSTRRKVPYEVGHSQMDWLRLARSGADLSGRGGARPRADVTLAEVAAHARAGDAWTVLRGRVYNITAYAKFHPGGAAQLMRGAGRDCTPLFDKYHAWVNAEFMLEQCLVGRLAPGEGAAADGAAADGAAADGAAADGDAPEAAAEAAAPGAPA